MTITVTLGAIRARGPCLSGWSKLIHYLGGIHKVKMGEPFPLSVVLDSNDLVDTVWCFYALGTKTRKRLTCLFLADCLDHAAKRRRNRWLTDAADLLRRYERGEAKRVDLTRFRKNAEAAHSAVGSAPYIRRVPFIAAYYAAIAALYSSSPETTQYAMNRIADVTIPADERGWQATTLRAYLDGKR